MHKNLSALMTALQLSISTREEEIARDKAMLLVLESLKSSGIEAWDFVEYLNSSVERPISTPEPEPEPRIDYGKFDLTRYQRVSVHKLLSERGECRIKEIKDYLYDNQPSTHKFWAEKGDMPSNYKLNKWLTQQDFIESLGYKFKIRDSFVDTKTSIKLSVKEEEFQGWVLSKRKFSFSDGIAKLSDLGMYNGGSHTSPQAYASLHKNVNKIFSNAKVKQVGRERIYYI